MRYQDENVGAKEIAKGEEKKPLHISQLARKVQKCMGLDDLREGFLR